VGKGTQFEVFLPMGKDTALPDPQTRPPTAGTRGSETILFAEDSDTVRHLCEKILQSAGYQLLTSSSGTEALSIAKEFRSPIHLLVTDTVMPGMGGAELALEVSRICPGVRVLFITGYTDRSIEDLELRKLGVAFLQKPFSKEAFLEKVREVLDAP